MSAWADWIGKSETRSDIITPGLLQRYCATINAPVTNQIPQGLHWCLCLPDTPTTKLAVDGHPEKGGFLPPIPLPRRMWASSNISFKHQLQQGDAVTRVSSIASIEEKSGQSGDLVFVAVDHKIYVSDQIVINERQNIVYRGPASASMANQPTENETPDLDGWDWQQKIIPCEKMLFRFSALTFNSHRIHYDQSYAMQEEGYPGLVVQGPLIATWLLNLAAQHLGANRLAEFSFRGQSPAFANMPIYLVGKSNDKKLTLAVVGAGGSQIMAAEAIV